MTLKPASSPGTRALTNTRRAGSGPGCIELRDLTRYRVLFLNTANWVCGAANIGCASDADALAEAERLLKWHPAAEVWQGDRVVGNVGGRKDRPRPAGELP